jgi:glycosyltransferase involved in cell wall biosynthesis
MANRRSDVLLGVSTYNEGENIEAWLKHWSSLVDDIVIVDQNSTDDTIDRINRFKATYDGSIDVFSAPTLGKCEPVYQAIEIMATHSNKWLLKMDVDEFMTPKQFNRLMEIAIKAKRDYNSTCVMIARKNMVDGADLSRIFANPSDEHGRDWQIRLSYGMVLNFGFGSHTHPAINGRWIMADADEVYIEHRRTFDGIVKANITRERYLTPEARQNQRAFIAKIGEVLGKTQEEVMAEVQKYVY